MLSGSLEGKFYSSYYIKLMQYYREKQKLEKDVASLWLLLQNPF